MPDFEEMQEVDKIRDPHKNPELYTPEEIAKIQAVGVEDFAGRCGCNIYEDRPSYCQQGPFFETLMPECSYYFIITDEGPKRMGECNQCGRCCALPRKDNSPYGVYDPRGGPCENLLMDGKLLVEKKD